MQFLLLDTVSPWRDCETIGLWYRRLSESLAYRVQLRTGHSPGRPYSSAAFAVDALMQLGMSRNAAERALR